MPVIGSCAVHVTLLVVSQFAVTNIAREFSAVRDDLTQMVPLPPCLPLM